MFFCHLYNYHFQCFQWHCDNILPWNSTQFSTSFIKSVKLFLFISHHFWLKRWICVTPNHSNQHIKSTIWQTFSCKFFIEFDSLLALKWISNDKRLKNAVMTNNIKQKKLILLEEKSNNNKNYFILLFCS